MKARAGALGGALVLAACAARDPGPPSSPASATTLPLPGALDASATTVVTAPFPEPRWLPRIADPEARPETDDEAGVYLGAGRVGLLLDGQRAVVHGASLAPLAVPTTEKLRRVVPLAPSLGGGFLFVGDRSWLFAPTYDGALTPVGPSSLELHGAGPHVVLLGDILFSTRDGTKIAGAPRGLTELVTPTNGSFVLGLAPTATWFSLDGAHWRKVGAGLTVAVANGDEVIGLVRTPIARRHIDEDSYRRIDVHGALSTTPSGTGSRWAYLRTFAGNDQPIPTNHPGIDGDGAARAASDGDDGVLIARGYLHTGRDAAEWMRVHDETIEVRRTGAPAWTLPLPSGGEDDALDYDLVSLEDGPHLVCSDRRARTVTVSSIELARRACARRITSGGMARPSSRHRSPEHRAIRRPWSCRETVAGTTWRRACAVRRNGSRCRRAPVTSPSRRWASS